MATAFYVPQREVDALAERIDLALHLSGQSDKGGQGEVSEASRREAEFQLQGAPTLQAIGRIRPNLAERLPDGEQLTIVLADDRPLPGLEVDASVEVDALALARGERTGKRWTADEVATALAPTIAAGGWIPSAGPENFDDETLDAMRQKPLTDWNQVDFQSQVSIAKGSISNTHPRLKNCPLPSAFDALDADGVTPDALADLAESVKQNAGGNWPEAADALSFEAVHFTARINGTGQSMVALVSSADEVDAEQLAERLEAVGSPARYVEFDGDRATVGADEVAEALDALAETAEGRATLDALADERLNKGDTHGALADTLGCSPSTARRRVRALAGGYGELADRAADRLAVDRAELPDWTEPAEADDYATPYPSERFTEQTATAPRFKSPADADGSEPVAGPEVAPRLKSRGDATSDDRAKSVRVSAARINADTLAEYGDRANPLPAVAPSG